MSEEKLKQDLSSLYSLWRVQDMLLQNYRAMFITMNSILLAFSGILLSTNKPFLFIGALILSALAIVLIFLWRKIWIRRGNCVYYVQAKIIGLEHKPGSAEYEGLSDFKKFERDKIETQEEKLEDLKQNLSEDPIKVSLDDFSRDFLNNAIPISFALLWFGSIILALLLLCSWI